MPPPLNIISFVFWLTAVWYRKLRRYLHEKAGESEEPWKKKHRYTNIFGLCPPKIHLLTAEEKKLSEMTRKRRASETKNTLPSIFQYVDMINFFARELRRLVSPTVPPILSAINVTNPIKPLFRPKKNLYLIR